MVATSAALPINNPNLRRRDVQIGERTFEVVPEFAYLGSNVSNDNRMIIASCAPEKSVHLKEPVATDEAVTI